MKKLFCYADMYLQKSDWKDMAMLKFCLFSIGLLVGMRIPEEHKKKTGIAAMFIFLLTYQGCSGKRSLTDILIILHFPGCLEDRKKWGDSLNCCIRSLPISMY